MLISGVYVNTHTHIGNLNSFRYRGYYYDTEIGMYYLQSRYYDPQVGRFINADDVEYLEPYIINGSNLYAYSLNNPVMYYDPDGYSFLLVGTGLGLLIKAAIALIAVGSIVIIESQFHPIENTINAISNIALTWWDNISYSSSRGGGRDSGFTDIPNNPEGNKGLEKSMEEARKAGNFNLANRIQRELKNRGWRNKKKKRGGPNMRGLWWLLLPRFIRRLLEYYED